MPEILTYGFMIRAFEAGIIIAALSPLIGIFLVLRRYSLIADTLAHVSFAGVTIGLISGLNPVLTSVVWTVLAALGIERLRSAKKIQGEMALAIFLSGSLALAVVLLGFGGGFNANVLSYLFGSIVTVKQSDIFLIAIASLLIALTIILLFKELVYASFDVEAAQVNGIPTKILNSLFIILAALAITISIPIVGVLLVSALLIIPAASALQLRLSFVRTIVAAECISIFSVIAGIAVSYYLDISAGATIVLLMLAIFSITLLIVRHPKKVG